MWLEAHSDVRGGGPFVGVRAVDHEVMAGAAGVSYDRWMRKARRLELE